MADFSEDILYNIFSRIPIKSLARFRCVCKQWREYINDPHFANIHHVKELKPMHIALIKSSNPHLQRVFVHSFLRVTEDTTDEIIMRVKKDLSSRFLVKRSINRYHQYKIQGYCNGLITLVQGIHHMGTTFVVINPLTKECHELPPMKLQQHTVIIAQGLGFDHSTNTFKMVCTVYDKLRNNKGTMVHVLGTDSWREIPQVPFYHVNGEAVYANGRLYWFAHTSSWDIRFEELVWLDMKKEEFGVIDLPKQRQGGYHNKLVDLNGELGFVYHNEGGSDSKVVEVWILKHEEWMIHCVFKCSSHFGWVVLGCWNNDGDILMSSSVVGSWFLVYRPKSGSFHRLNGPEDDPGKEKIEVRMHQSSLLSILKWH